jgi:hypothetical protein
VKNLHGKKPWNKAQEVRLRAMCDFSLIRGSFSSHLGANIGIKKQFTSLKLFSVMKCGWVRQDWEVVVMVSFNVSPYKKWEAEANHRVSSLNARRK